MKNKILQISKELGLTHIGSNLSILPILKEIYAVKKPKDKVILDNAHAHLAHLLVYATQLGVPPDADIGFAKDMIEKYGIHCDRKSLCDASGGSLGHGIGISIGYAFANPDINVYCIVSDGSMMEGSNWEALRIRKDLKLYNLKIYCNFNSYSAVANVDLETLCKRLMQFCPGAEIRYTKNGKGFEGIQGHYKKL